VPTVTRSPSAISSFQPSSAPSNLPSRYPSSFSPSQNPTKTPSAIPSVKPSSVPSLKPSVYPTNIPTSGTISCLQVNTANSSALLGKVIGMGQNLCKIIDQTKCSTCGCSYYVKYRYFGYRLSNILIFL
jgi:hypothetical protein